MATTSAVRKAGILLLAVCLTSVGLAAAGATAGASPARHEVPGTTPKWLTRAHAVGRAPTAAKVDFGLLLKMRDAASAEAQLQRISAPGSSDYGTWLSDAQFATSYGPAASDVAAVRHWLQQQGFQIRTTLHSGMYVEASGTVDQVEKTFGTTVNTYSYKGVTVRSNATALSLPTTTPAAVVSAIDGVIGVDQGSALKTPADALPGPPPGARYGVQPCSAYYGQKIATDKPAAYGAKQPYAVCGYRPQQYQSAYGLSTAIGRGIDGRGITVAITDAYAAPTILQDAQEYSQYVGQPRFANGQFSQILPSSYDQVDECGGSGWYGEETLDVEAVHAMAPGAKVVYVGGSDCLSGLDEAWANSIDNHVADVITNSWTDGTDDIDALGQSYVDFYTQFALEAALTGITVNFSTGDDGDLTGGGANPSAKSVEFPADVPWVTGVGGTSVGIGARGNYLWEHGWQTAYSTLTDGAWTPPPPGTYNSGGGGGTSVLFGQPFYQRGVVPTSISEYFSPTPHRTLPDISMPGDPNTGFLVGETQAFPDGTYWDTYRIGGTSLSSPLLAGVDAVLGSAIHRPIGFANPLYYFLSRTPAVHDIVAPSSPLAQVRTDYANFLDASEGYLFRLQTVDVQSSTIHSRPGYDDETGVGSPNVGWLLDLVPGPRSR